MANPLDPTFSPLTTRTAEPPLPTVGDYATAIRQAGLAPRQGFVEEPEMPSVRTARLAYSPSQKKFFVGGYTFDDDNDTAAVTMSKYANQEAPLPEGDWQEVDPASYAQYVERIRDPGFFQQIANNFDIGLDEMQQTLGYGLMFAGAEETGRWLADQESDLAKTQVYQRNIENIGENGVLDWIAATIGRLGPNVVESVITAGVGAGIGSAVPGAGTAGGAVLGFFGKTAVKKALYEAAKKQFKGQALDAAEKKLLLSAAGMVNTASNAAKTKLAPGALNQFMQEGLQTGAENVARRVAARAPTEMGAVGLSTASNIFQQTGQAYGETMAGGGEGNRAVALGVGTIGGLADTAGEFLLAGRVFSEAVGDVAGSVTKRQKALNLIKRIGAGAGVGAGMEGTTEAFQEALQLAANPVVNIGTAEGQSRLLNAFAGGALLGGGFGGAGGIFAGSLSDNKQEANLLLPVSKDDPNYAQYREDVKRQLGEAEYNKVFGPPQPYTRLMEEETTKASQVPLTGAVPTTFQVQPTPPINFGSPNVAIEEFGMAGTATGTLPQGAMVPTVSDMAPAPVAPPPSPTISMGGTMTPGQMGGMGTFEQFQAAAMQQAMAAQQAAQQVAAAPAPAPLTRMPGGSALQQAVTGELPGAQPPGSMMLRRGPGSALAQTAEMQGPAAPMPGSPTVNMNRLLRGGTSGRAPATMVPPLRPTSIVGRAGDISLRRSGQATGRMVPPMVPTTVKTGAPSPTGGRADALAFLSTLVSAGQNTFNTSELGSYLFPKKTKLTAVDRQRVNVVVDKLIRDKLVAEGPIGTYTVDTEKVRATQPGTGTGGAAPAGERGGKDGGTGKSGPLRKGAAATREETAPKAEGPAAGGEEVRKETRKPVVVEKRQRKKLTAKAEDLQKGKEPERPKGVGEAAPAKTAETAPAPEAVAPKVSKSLAATVREEAGKLRTLMRNGEDLPSPESDLDDVYFAVAQVMNADDRRRPAAMDELLSWATESGINKDARDAARAYIDTYVEDEDTTAAKARREAKQEAAKEARKAEKNALKSMDAERKKGRNMLSMYDSVENAVDEDGRPLKPIDRVKFKSIVDTFKRGLAKAPQISIYKNQADLRAKNPSLYQRAVAARPQGDFDTAQAAGYAFGEDQVIIFSDRIATPKMLRMVLAHEAIGHFGMRALLSVKQFDALMDYVYDNSPLARAVVDSEVEYSGMDRREAIEEYLANYASKLDTSIVTRIWNTIKGALNKLGIQFEDDLTRYLVNHARRYTREGASFFEPSKFALKVLDVESSMNGSGRFNIPSILPMQRELSFKLDMAGGMPATLTEAWSDLKDRGVNTAQSFDNLVRTVFRLANYDALRNHGAAAYETLINGVRTVVAALRNQYNEDLADIMGLGEEGRNAFSYSMYIGRSIAHQRFKLDPGMRSASLVKLVKDPDTGETQIVADNEQLEKFLKLGTVSKDELNNGVTVKVPLPTSIFGTYKADEIKIEGVRSRLGRDLTDEEYQYYLKGRRKMAEIEIDLLKARYENYLKTEKISISGVRKILNDGNLTEADMALVRNALNHAKSLIAKKVEYDAQGLPTITSDGLSEANAFLAKFNEALIKNDEKYTDALKGEVRAFYENAKQSDAAINAIEKFRERRRTISPELTRDIVFAVQDRLKEIVLADQMFEKAQAQARRTIAQGYIPVFREGGWQTRVEGQIDGKPVTLHPEHQNKLILRLEEDRASSERGAKALNEAFKGVEAEVLVLQGDGTYKTQKVTLFARASKAIDNVAADPSLDIDNFLHGMRMFGLATNPQAIERVITTLTNPGNALRKALRFDDTPGYDMTAGITAMSRHIVTRASLIAKTQFEPAMRELLDRTSDRGKLWFGDAEAVMTAKTKFDVATDERERAFYRNELITNLYKYRTTNPGAANWDGSRATFPGNPEGAELGNVFYNNAIRTQQWLDGSENIAESTFEGKRMPAFLKAVTSVAFLGGSMAQFAQNLISPITNVIPYLASKNGKTGFGGGFGTMAASIEYSRAFKDVVGISGLKPFSRVKDESGKYSFRIGDPTNDAKYYFDIAKKFEVSRAAKDAAEEARLQAEYGLSYYEARNIGREIREGKLIPAQANAVLETSRGLYADSKLGRAWLKFTDVYMVPFNVSEQAARRATFLAAFRLEFNRLKQAGMDEEAASERARAFGVQTVDFTLGEYSNTNRPPAWREGVQSLLFMYKTYPITATLLMRNLSYGGKIGMLTGLMLLSGLSGLPFAEDIEDLIDTLAQKFGMDIGQGPALRKFLTEQLDEAFPGIAPYVIKGVANQFLPADIASKTGIGNILPGTGALLAGSDPSHELAEVAGPIFGMGYNMVKATYDVIRAPVSDTATLTDAFRNAPVSLVRSIGDVAMYLQSGAIVDKRGYVVSPEVSAATVLTRLLGFYPVEASNQYEFIKYSRRATDFQKQVSMAYRDAWIKAKMVGDEQQAAKVAQAVNDWNEANPNARLNNWMKNAQRSLKEARRPAGERFLKSAPKASRENLERYLNATIE